MTLLNWNKDYELGLPEIDEQHRMFVDMVNELSNQIQSGQDRQGLLDGLQGMQAYAEYHFKDEERMMADSGFPGLEEHKAVHRDFLDQLQALNPADMAEDKERASEALSYFLEWFVRHIRRKDRDYVGMVKK